MKMLAASNFAKITLKNITIHILCPSYLQRNTIKIKFR